MRTMSKDFTDEEMLNSLKEFYVENNRVPYMKDFKGRKPSSDMISRRFGKWSVALELAGIERKKLRESDYNKEELIDQIHDFIKKNNKAPTVREMRKQGYAGIKSFINYFGSFKNALIEAGVFELREDKHQFCKEYTDKELLEELKKYMLDRDRIPTYEVMKETMNPSISTYDRRFNGAYNAFKLIGYDIGEQRERDVIKLQEDMIAKYRELAIMIGEVPSSRDIERYSRKGLCYAMKTYENHFGSLYELQVLCDMIPTRVGRNKSKEDLIKDLKTMAEELDRTPSQNDIRFFKCMACSAKFAKEFGSWNEAIKAAGLKPNSKVYYSTKGEKCYSYYELLFTNMFEDNNIKYTKEDYYKDYMPIEERYRFDYKIEMNNQTYFVEIFGITCREDYQDRIKTKIELCRRYNIDLIEVYPKDFTSYKLEDIYDMLINKINNKQN